MKGTMSLINHGGIPSDPEEREDLDFCRSSDCNTNHGLGHGVAKVGAVQDILDLGRKYCGSVETEA